MLKKTEKCCRFLGQYCVEVQKHSAPLLFPEKRDKIKHKEAKEVVAIIQFSKH